MNGMTVFQDLLRIFQAVCVAGRDFRTADSSPV